MNKQDLTQYSDSELSLLVFNEEWLYNDRHKPWFIDSLEEFFIYSAKQLGELKQDIQADLEEK